MSQEAQDGDRRIGVSKVRVWLSDDKATLFISFGGHNDLTVELITTQVDQMLEAIAEWREKMSPAIPAEYTPVRHVTAQKNPAWYSEPEISMGGSLLHIRHPAFGWISLWLEKSSAAKLATLLQEQIKNQN